MSTQFDTKLFLDLYRHMATTRFMDELEKSLAQRGEVPFYVPSSGHESTAALAPHLRPADWLHCHYRDKALLLARGMAIDEFFLLLLGKNEGSSRGRRMPGFPTDPSLNILSPCTVVGNSALQATGIAAAIKDSKDQPIVLCNVGDGATQEGEFLEAVAETVRSNLPVLFVIQDNHFALSTQTQRNTFYSLPSGKADSFYGLTIHRVKGSDTVAFHDSMREVIDGMRKDRGPRIVLMDVERLTSHTNSDDHRMYRSEEEIQRIREQSDPVTILRSRLLKEGVLEDELACIDDEITTQLHAVLDTARAGTEPVTELTAKKPLPAELTDASAEYRGKEDVKELSMLEAMRAALHNRLSTERAGSSSDAT